MAMTEGRIRVGVGGWDSTLRESFYPLGLPKEKQLEHRPAG